MTAPARPPWGAIVAALAALVFAAPALVLPADGPVATKLVFVAFGAVLLGVAIVLTRREPAAPRPVDGGEEGDDVTP